MQHSSLGLFERSGKLAYTSNIQIRSRAYSVEGVNGPEQVCIDVSVTS